MSEREFMQFFHASVVPNKITQNHGIAAGSSKIQHFLIDNGLFCYVWQQKRRSSW